MTLRIYLDTSVVSACVDPRDPVRQDLTRQFWGLLSSYEPCISPFVLKEIEATPDEGPRREMLVLTAKLRILPVGAETERLAAAYVAEGAFASTLLADARHVAAAVVADVPVLVSWNFRHLVNRTRRIRVNLVNSKEGYGQIEIIAPPELA